MTRTHRIPVTARPILSPLLLALALGPLSGCDLGSSSDGDTSAPSASAPTTEPPPGPTPTPTPTPEPGASNRAPLAAVVADPDVTTGATVTLDGSPSTDPDGDSLTFLWSLVATPAGSAAELSDPDAVRSSFVADVDGDYEAELIVDDGELVSQPARAAVTASTSNLRPLARPGPDQNVAVGATVQLDGSRSRDDDGDPITFGWSLTSIPEGSGAELAAPTSPRPTFVADREGAYVVTLVVSDGLADSRTQEVVVTASTANAVPVADAGPDQEVEIGPEVALDGTGSSDGDGDPLTYRWSLTAVPAGSGVRLRGPRTDAPRFNADVAGDYVAQLVVRDGRASSAPDTTVVTAVDPSLAGCDPDAILCDPLLGSTTGRRSGGGFVDGGWQAPGQIAWDLGRPLDQGAFAAELDNWDPSSGSGQHRYDKQHILNMFEAAHGSTHTADDDGTGFFNLRTGRNYDDLFKYLSSTNGFLEREETRLSPPGGRVDPGRTHVVRVEWTSGGQITVRLDGEALQTHTHPRAFALRHVFVGTDNSAGYGPQSDVIYRNVQVWESPDGGR